MNSRRITLTSMADESIGYRERLRTGDPFVRDIYGDMGPWIVVDVSEPYLRAAEPRRMVVDVVIERSVSAK